MNKKSFTLLEIILVILILWILFSAYQNFFSADDRYFIQSQTCYNNVYGNIKNFIDDAASGKWYITWWNQTYFPTWYNIIVNTASDATSGEVSIKLSYNYNWTIYDYKKIYLNAKYNGSNPCESTNYKIKIWDHTNISSISMMKMLQWNLNEQPFLIKDNSNNSILTWKLSFTYCNEKNGCKDLWVMIFDKRTWIVSFNKCLYRNPRDADWNQTCKNRSLNWYNWT